MLAGPCALFRHRVDFYRLLSLRKRLQTPAVVDVGRQRARLTTRLEQIRKQNGWGDLPDAEYLSERDSIRASLAALPDNDRIRSFDAYRARVLELPEAIAVAPPARREELCRIVIDRFVVNDRQVETIVWIHPSGRSSKDSGCAPKGAQAPTRCQMRTRWLGTWHEATRQRWPMSASGSRSGS
jgi:hypothetical protein